MLTPILTSRAELTQRQTNMEGNYER